MAYNPWPELFIASKNLQYAWREESVSDLDGF